MRKVLIAGAGQSGLQLALGLRADGHDVTLFSARTPRAIRGVRPMSTQGMFHDALETERDLGLDLWDGQAPAFEGFRVTLSAPPGEQALAFNARLSHPGRSVDQRLRWSPRGTWP